MLGVNLALRAGKEYKSLRRPGFDLQLEIVSVSGVDCICYTEDISTKSNQGGLKHCGIRPKVVTIYPCKDESRCSVSYFKRYLAQFLKSGKCKDFYLQCNSEKKISEGELWYKDRPVGINTLASPIKRITGECGLEGFFTNHSLRSTAATVLHNAPDNISEQVICETTGHRSTAVCMYKCTQNEVKERASNILTDVTSGQIDENVGVNVPLQPMKNSVLKASRKNESDVDENVKRVKLDITVNVKQSN